VSDLSAMSPVEIDTYLADNYAAEQRARTKVSQYAESIRSAADKRPWRERRAGGGPSLAEAIEVVKAQGGYVARYVEDLAQAQAEVAALVAAAEPYEAQYEARRWSRAFLALSSNGHVHSSRSCSTCYSPRYDERTGEWKPGTAFGWFPQYSGLPEEQIVADAGERACTVCYPSAPVDVLKRPTKFFSEDELAKAKAREEREAKRAAKEAAQITVEGYRPYSGKPRTHVFKTERAATNAIAENLSSLAWYGPSHPSGTEWLANIEAIREALAAKGIEYDYDKAEANARKRVTREGGTPKF
jgi:hypothetical protein